jgi:hypothetical protein
MAFGKDTIDLGFGVRFIFCKGCSEVDQMDVFHPIPSSCSGVEEHLKDLHQNDGDGGR